LPADAPGPQILDQLKGWKRLYADNIAVIHIRDREPDAAGRPKP
jgi:hypothetical protein